MEVDDAEEGVAGLLRRDVLAEAAAVVAEVLGAGGLDAAEDAHVSSILAQGRRASVERRGAGGLSAALRAHAPAAPATPGPAAAPDGSHRAHSTRRPRPPGPARPRPGL